LDKCYVSNRTYLGNSKVEVFGAVFFDPNTYLWMHNSFESSHSMYNRLDSILDSDEGLFLLTKQGVYRQLPRTRTTEHLIEGSYKKFPATKLELISKDLLLLGADSGEIMIYDQTQRRVAKVIADFHSSPLVSIKKMLTSIDAVPLIYTVCKEGNLLCFNVNDLNKPFIKFDCPFNRQTRPIRIMDIIDPYKLLLIVTSGSIVLYNVLAKSKLCEISFTECLLDVTLEITSAVKINANLLEIEYLLFDSKGNVYFINLMDFEFVKFNLENQSANCKTTETAIELKSYLISSVDGVVMNSANFSFGEGNFFAEVGKSVTKMQIRKRSKPYFWSPSFVTGLPLKTVFSLD